MAPGSSAWTYFSKSKDGKQVKCKCGTTLSYKNSTTNMLLHIKNVHKVDLPTLPAKGGVGKRTFQHEDKNEDDADAPQPEKLTQARINPGYTGPIERCFSNITAFSGGGNRDATCTDALLYMIAVDAMPLSTVERKGFRKFTNTLQPLYNIPAEPTITKLLREKYVVLRERVGQKLKKANYITLTCDLWTHKYTMRGYLGVTAHFCEGTEVVSFELGARLMDERKTTANLRVVLRGVCTDWQIDYSRVRAVVSDGGANIKAAIKEEFGSDKHISCISHQLNNIGQKAIGSAVTPVPSERQQLVDPDLPEDESDLIDEDEGDTVTAGISTTLRELLIKVKKVVRFFKSSEVATSKLVTLQRTEEGKTEDKILKLIQEVRTRWNSCYAMVERYLVLAPSVNRVLYEIRREKSSKSKPPEPITSDEEEALKDVKDLLAPLYHATNELSKNKIVTLSLCIPVIRSLKQGIETYLASTPIGFNLQHDLLAAIDGRFASIEEVKLFAAATLLDPRFKKFAFSKHDRAPIRIANAITFVGGLVTAKMREAKDTHEQSQHADEPTPSTSAAGQFWSSFDQDVMEQSASTSGQDMAGGIPIQLRMYLDSPPVNREANTNPLAAWNVLKGEYNYVHAVAEEYLSILATSVPTERLFSHAGLIANQLRTRLSGKNLEMLVFLRSCPESMWFG